MKTSVKNVTQYRATLQNYALLLSLKRDFMDKLGLSETKLDEVFSLPHGPRESEFVKYTLEMDRLHNGYQKAA